jgi:hypothetical protein
MGNMSSYYIQAVGKFFHKSGMIPRYLPTYGSDLNPIEMMWSKTKAFLQKWKICTSKRDSGCNLTSTHFGSSRRCTSLVYSFGIWLLLLVIAIDALSFLQYLIDKLKSYILNNITPVS